MLQLSQILRLTIALPMRRLAVALLAAAALTACGGGGGSDSGSSQLDSRSPLSEERDTQTSEPGEQDDTTDDPGSDTSDTTDEETGSDDTEGDDPNTDEDGSTDTDGGDSGSDEPVSDNPDPAEDDTTSDDPDQGDDTTDDSASDDTADDDTSSDDSLVDTEAQLFQIEGSVTFEWERPIERENGDILPTDQLGGYEFRYRAEGSDEYEMMLITDTNEAVHIETLEELEGVYEFSVAAYDSEGLYSDFVPLEPTDGAYNRP